MASSKILPFIALGSSHVGGSPVQLGQAWPNQEVVAC